MAKKGAVVQLQIDVSTDEEWDKSVSRDGLIVIDVYSDWCGPCLAMSPNLRKIKLEQGEDFLQLASAKADNITCLKRFVGKSEPTWMFMAQGQMVELLFGANAPLLQRTILDQMKKEKECLSNQRTRIIRPPEAYSDEEKVFYNAIERKEQFLQKLALDKARKILTERRTAQAKNILDTMAHVGVVLIFPHAVRRGPEVLDEFWAGSGLSSSKKERPQITEEALEDIEFFSPYKIGATSVNHLISDKSLAMMIIQDETVTTPIDETVLKLIYGRHKAPPGDPESPANLLIKKQPKKEEPIEVVSKHEIRPSVTQDKLTSRISIVRSSKSKSLVTTTEDFDLIDGIWAPANELVRATALKYFFPLITSPLILPEAQPIPPHVAMAFDTLKRREILDFAKDFENDIMSYGYFTSQDSETARFIAKTTAMYEKKHKETEFGEKLVLKINRKKSDTVLALAQLGPTYISPNVVEGEHECARFFPEGYDDIEEIVAEEVAPIPPKKTTRKSVYVEDPGRLLVEEIAIEIPESVEVHKFLSSEGVVGIEFEVRQDGEEEDLMGMDVIPPMDEFGEQMTGMPDVEGFETQEMVEVKIEETEAAPQEESQVEKEESVGSAKKSTSKDIGGGE